MPRISAAISRTPSKVWPSAIACYRPIGANSTAPSNSAWWIFYGRIIKSMTLRAACCSPRRSRPITGCGPSARPTRFFIVTSPKPWTGGCARIGAMPSHCGDRTAPCGPPGVLHPPRLARSFEPHLPKRGRPVLLAARRRPRDRLAPRCFGSHTLARLEGRAKPDP